MSDQVKAAIQRGAELFRTTYLDDLIANSLDEGRAFESPFERDFYVWWACIRDGDSEYQGHRAFLALRQQREVQCGNRKYRLDFQVSWDDPPDDDIYLYHADREIDFKLAIELDGHDFHERTKEQVAYRDRRDRDLQLAGWVVLHLSGSPFYRNPEKEVRLLLDQIYPLVSEWRAAVWREVARLRTGGKVDGADQNHQA